MIMRFQYKHSFDLVQVLTLQANACHWVTGTSLGVTSAVELFFQVPIEGHVSIWFTDKRRLPGMPRVTNPKHNWQIPVAKLLRIAKVQLKENSI